MGGEGAKERRRMKRLAAQGGGDKSGMEKKFVPVKRNDARIKPVSKHQQQKKSYATGGKAVGRFNNNNNKTWSKNGGSSSKFQTKSKKKNKPKKPKHLKRKLEQLGEEESKEREAVLKKINDWERVKGKFSFHKKNARNSNINEQKNETTKENDNGAVETEDFPRGISSENIANNIPVEEAEPEPDTAENASSKLEKDIPKNDDSDSDDEPTEPRRQRGRRRRGRKDTAKQIAETKPMVEDAKFTLPVGKGGNDSPGVAEIDEEESKKSEIKKEKDPNRYCTGRKPVTDFVIGQCYTGKVVYVKAFGVFIDIGCHSDAFCHVSRLSDDYVESPEAMLQEGDELNPRVVEIDRKQKKITVSLQSEAKITDEQKSIAARKERRESRKKSKPKSKPRAPKKDFKRDDSVRNTPASYEKPAIPQPVVGQQPPKPKSTPILPPDESTMTPAELKRARKLARRAARREQAEAAGNQ